MALSTAKIEIAPFNNYVFPNASLDDLVVYTTSSSQRMFFGTQSNSPASVVITSNFVGVGKTNPSYTLDVNGQINASEILINGAGLSTSVGGGFNAQPGNITFTSCNVGIGLSNPSTPLHVFNAGSNGWLASMQNAQVQTLISHSNGNGIRIVTNTTSSNTAGLEINNGSNIIFYARNDGIVGIGTSNISASYALNVSGAINASGAVTSSSDARLKTNIERIVNAVEKIQLMKGYTFTFTDDMEERRQVGLIAQEINETLPEVVFEDENGYLSVAYGNIVALLIEAIKSQQTSIDSLCTRLEKLEKRMMEA